MLEAIIPSRYNNVQDPHHWQPKFDLIVPTASAYQHLRLSPQMMLHYHQLQDLIQSQVGKHRIQYLKEYKFAVANAKGLKICSCQTLEDFTKDVE